MSDGVQRTGTRRRKSRSLVLRMLFLLFICGIASFAVLAARLYQIQIVDNKYYESRALQFQLSNTEISASRGTIFDRNGKILAISASVENVFISPYEINRDGHDIGFIADRLSEILAVPRESIVEMAAFVNSQYQIVKAGVEDKEAQLVRELIRANRLTGIHLEPGTKRYYPNNSLACQVLGFTGQDNIGLDGLEQRYNSLLTGVDGRTVRLRNALGNDLLFTDYDDYFAAQDGYSISLTIDSSTQYYVEKHLEQAIIDYDVKNGATCIVMNAKTGEILAEANYPNYDPNDFLSIGERELEQLSTITNPIEYAESYYAAQLRQWRDRSLSDTYEPGSVFKIMTLAMGIEEGVVSLGDHYHCLGQMDVLGRDENEPLHCWNTLGHGVQSLGAAMQNSCNMASVEMALNVSARIFYKYIDAFGLFDKTGIDANTEANSIWWDESVFFDSNNHSQLASASFGQTFKVTPMQMITAAAATINGGYLMQPYIVSQIVDSNGDIVEAREPTVLRQVISSETSAIVREILEEVVKSGTGRNAQVRGYRVGGKTGTSENVEQLSAQEDQDAAEKDYIASFIGFAPADDPEIIVLLLLDTPSHETGVYISGGAMAAPVVGNILADILPLALGIKPQYSDEDFDDINVDMPRLIGRSIEDAQLMLSNLGFSWEIIGDGESITNQLPAPNAYVASGTRVMLYAGEDMPNGQATVPLLAGMPYDDAKQVLESCGLFIRTTGAPKSDNRTEVSVQSMPAGGLAEYGSIVEVTLINKDAVERN